jgi:hypothetical protein
MLGATHTPLPALDHNHPRFQELLMSIFAKYPTNCHKYDDWDPVPPHPYSVFLQENGYLGLSSDFPSHVLKNPNHAIFDVACWINGVLTPDLIIFLRAEKPALQLASLFLADPSISKFFAHILYGVPAYNAEGRVYLAHSYRENSEFAYYDVQVGLLAVAEKVKFLFKPSETIPTLSGQCQKSLQLVVQEFENILDGSFTGSDPFWYNPWPRQNEQEPIISLPVWWYEMCFAIPTITTSLRLRYWFLLAKTLVHEIVHACVRFWQPSARLVDEPLIDADDLLEEAGVAWEKFAPGGRFSHDICGPLICFEVEHYFDGVNFLPLTTLVPDAWINRWFDRRTWDAIPVIRETLHAPIADISSGTFSVARECGGFRIVQLYNGNNKVLTNEERAPGYRKTLGQAQPFPLSINWKDNPAELAEQYRECWQREHGTLPAMFEQPLAYTRLVKTPSACRSRHLESENDLDFGDVEGASQLKASRKCSCIWHPKEPTELSSDPFSQRSFNLQYPEISVCNMSRGLSQP